MGKMSLLLLLLPACLALQAVPEHTPSVPMPETHRCIHDHIMKDHMDHEKSELFNIAETRRREAPLHHSDLDVRHHEEATGLNIHFDLTYVSNDAAACAAAGETYNIGNVASPPICSASQTQGCFGTCTEAMVMSTQKREAVNAMTTDVKNRLASALKVVNPAAIQLNAGSCGAAATLGAATIQSQMTAPAEGIDIVILVTTRPTTGGVVAHGVSCQQTEEGRPVAGHLNIGAQYIDSGNVGAMAALTNVVLHETLHILGVSFSHFSNFKDEFGNPHETVTVDVPTGRGNSITKIVTPRVTAVARQHFDCARIDGIELEDGGGSGTRLSHLEKRVFMNEIMTGSGFGSMLPEPKLSYFTLALLEDSGWYVGNYDSDQVDALEFGYHQGCGFWDGQCLDWKNYFCDVPNEGGCLFDRSGKGRCVINEWGSIPSHFHYFSSPTQGGFSALADFCAIYTPASVASSCALPDTSSDAIGAIEKFGSGTKCFMSTARNATAPYVGIVEPRCFAHVCTGTGADATLDITVVGASGDHTIRCPKTGGQVMDPTQFQGYIVCPRADEVCFTTSIVAPPAPHGAASTLIPSLALFVLCALLL